MAQVLGWAPRSREESGRKSALRDSSLDGRGAGRLGIAGYASKRAEFVGLNGVPGNQAPRTRLVISSLRNKMAERVGPCESNGGRPSFFDLNPLTARVFCPGGCNPTVSGGSRSHPSERRRWDPSPLVVHYGGWQELGCMSSCDPPVFWQDAGESGLTGPSAHGAASHCLRIY